MNYVQVLKRRCFTMDFLEIVSCFTSGSQVRSIIFSQFITWK